MADEETTSWGKALAFFVQRNLESDSDAKPGTWYALHVALAKLPDSGQTAPSWKRTITRIRKGEVPSEKHAQLIAAALQVERESLPPSSNRLTLKDLERRLEALEATVDEQAVEIAQSLEAVWRGIGHSGGAQSGEDGQERTP